MRNLNMFKRFTAPTPEFFKKIRKVGVYLTTISVIILAGNSQFSLNLPSIVDSVGHVFAYMGFAAATVASFAVDEEKLREQEWKKQNS